MQQEILAVLLHLYVIAQHILRQACDFGLKEQKNALYILKDCGLEKLMARL